jgi:hypothetical protein
MPETALHTCYQSLDAVELSFDDFKKIVINDYRVGFESRQASLLGRREVLTGKAKFGIFGDGKEVAQLAMAKAFRKPATGARAITATKPLCLLQA